ncbi:MAG: Mu-like prophage major head subunit gpT family protein [Lentisphaeria bacterium]|nr:Mu-like prophage major head subunit gpT family protein [Lentisphaeria bacterium]
MSEFTLIEASGEGRPKIVGIAYSGGKMPLPGWKNPVVVDLSGMELPESVPLLANHENRTSARVGMVSASVKNNVLEITGEIISDSPEAADIVAQSKAGADWQLSIGADVKECELVRSKREVNGQEIEGPFYHVRKSALREVSVVAVGADAHTRMKVTAKFDLINPNPEEEGETMNENKEIEAKADVQPEIKPEVQAEAKPETTPEVKPEIKAEVKPEIQAKHEPEAAPVDVAAAARNAAAAAIKAERERVAAIRSICNGEFPEIEKDAISAGWTPEVVTKKVLETMRAERPSADVHITVKTAPEGDDKRKVIEAAMCLRCGVSSGVIEKAYDEKTIEAGMKEMDMPLKQLLIECMKLDGISYGHGFDNETIRAAFSSVSLPGILSNVANKKLLQSYESQPVIATKLCSVGDLNDFKENDRFRLTDVGDLLPVGADGEIKDGGVTEEAAKNQLETYGKTFVLTRKMIINDALGAFMKVPVAMGNRAARLIDQLFFSRLLKNPVQLDGKALFSSAHKNLISGANSALSADSLKKAIQLFLDQVDADGQPISIEPRFLLVPSALKHHAIELTRGATFIMAGGGDNSIRPAINSLVDENLQVISSPYLANSAYEGNSATAWYLFGNPRQTDTFELGFLRGKRTPTVERGETDFNTLGMWFRVYFDVGVREQDHRGMVKSTGAANG